MDKFCRTCGSALVLKELKNEGTIPYCAACGEYRFPMYNVAVSMIVRSKASGKILLIQQYGRKINVLVAGYVNRGESAEDAVVREVREETGMTVVDYHFNRTKFFEKSNTLMCNFTAFVESEEEMTPNEEIDAYAWYTEEEAKEAIYHGSLAEEFLFGYLSIQEKM